MKKTLSLLCLGLGLAFSGLAGADDLVDAEVRKVDKDAGKLTLRHGEIRNLDMPPMTMVFVAKDKTMLDKVKAGDKIRFKAIKDGDSYVVTEIQGTP